MSDKMRQSFNKVVIEGWLNKKEFEIKIDKNGREFISGIVEIRTDETNIVPVEMFSYKETKEGKENKIYKSMLTIMNDYKDSTTCENWQNADKARIANGEIRSNEFIGKDNELHNNIRYVTNFINRVRNSSFNPQSKFSCEVIFAGERPEIKNEEETGRGIVNGFFVDFMSNLKPVSFIVGKKLWSKIEGEFEKGETIYLTGDIVNKAETKIITVEMEFGEDEERVITNSVRERIVTGIKRVEEEKEYTKTQIKNAFNARNEYIEGLKIKQELSIEEEDEISIDDLPF